MGALGGRAAEEVIFGDAEVTTGASGDLQQVCAWRLGDEVWRLRLQQHSCILCSAAVLKMTSVVHCPGAARPVFFPPSCRTPADHTPASVHCPLQVSNMARAMVINYGFSEIGPFSLLDPSAQVRCRISSHRSAVSWPARPAGRGSPHSPSPSTPAPSTMLASHHLLPCQTR